jgi:hypothetical protein
MQATNEPKRNTSQFARFPLGQTYLTPGAEEALLTAGQTGIEFLRRHVSGDWSGLPSRDAHQNEVSLQKGLRVFSAYQTSQGQKLWIITEADRSSTTILLPSEY